MSIVFISDLHLEDNRPDITDIFLKFLDQQSTSAKALYILGDFFEVWIGDDNLTDFNKKIISALKKATEKGLPIYLMHGNRDFLLGKNFLNATGCVLLPDEFVIDIYGTPALVMHGDTLCTLDIKYQKFRKKSRNKFFQMLFLLKSLKKRRAIADDYRAKSKNYMSTIAENITDVTEDEVRRVMKKHNVAHLIHGHTHRPNVHQFNLFDVHATRTVLHAWHDRGYALVCTPDGKREFVSF